MKALVTGFDAFGGDKINPSALASRQLKRKLGGVAIHTAMLPTKACVAEMRKAGLPAAVSNTAGTFVCNNVFYALMDMAARHPIPMRAGFLHIPYVPEQVARVGNAPSMALDDIVRGIEIVVAVSAVRTSDVHTAEGRLS